MKGFALFTVLIVVVHAHDEYLGKCPEFEPMQNFDWNEVSEIISESLNELLHPGEENETNEMSHDHGRSHGCRRDHGRRHGHGRRPRIESRPLSSYAQ